MASSTASDLDFDAWSLLGSIMTEDMPIHFDPMQLRSVQFLHSVLDNETKDCDQDSRHQQSTFGKNVHEAFLEDSRIDVLDYLRSIQVLV
jgi:hypothetical protein